jgi:hypothetical protein
LAAKPSGEQCGTLYHGKPLEAKQAFFSRFAATILPEGKPSDEIQMRRRAAGCLQTSELYARVVHRGVLKAVDAARPKK